MKYHSVQRPAHAVCIVPTATKTFAGALGKAGRMLRTRMSPAAVAVLIVWASLSGPAAAGGFDTTTYQAFLDRYVRTDRVVKGYRLNVVDYGRLVTEREGPASLYHRVLAEFAAADPESLPTRDDRIAFWINAYNIGAVKLIIDHYPVDSIRSRSISFFRNPWGIKVLDVGGRRYALGEIEHEILLGRLQEPMAHFAIVCASLSCPELRPTAYTGDAVDRQMAEQARRFLADPKKGLRLAPDDGTVFFSKIFKFDRKTFPDGARDAVPLITPYVDESTARLLRRRDYRVEYLDYDWSLNASGDAD